MKEPLYAEMARMEEGHFWFTARRKILRTILLKYLGADRRLLVCDLGCGCGINLRYFGDLYTMAGMDASPHAIRFCRERGLEAKQGSLPDEIPFEPGTFDACLMLDVLEHVERDREAVLAAGRLLKPGGILLSTVPAGPGLYIGRDAYHGHKRRYTRRAFQGLFPEDFFRIRFLSHFNTLLFPLIASWRKALRKTGRDKAGPDLFLLAAPLNSLLSFLFSAERFLLPHFTLPFGLSLIGVAERKGR